MDAKDARKRWSYKMSQGRYEFYRGPFTNEEILQEIAENRIDMDTPVKFKDGPWYPASHYAYLRVTKKGSGALAKTVYAGLILMAIFFIGMGIISFVKGDKPASSSVSDSMFRNKAGTNKSAQQSIPREPLSASVVAEMTNGVRIENGLSILSRNSLLDAVAEARVADMFEKQYIGHVSPTGEQASDVAQRVGYKYKVIAENITKGNFQNNRKIIDSWMQSPGHKSNILSEQVAEIGVALSKGRFQGGDACIAVQIFGLQSPQVSTSRCPIPPAGMGAGIDARKRELETLNTNLREMQIVMAEDVAAIEEGRRTAGNDRQALFDLSVRTRTYNERVNRHNSLLADIKAKTIVLNEMIEQYNKIVNCQ